MKTGDLIVRIKHLWMKIRLCPVHVLCFHHVSIEYDAETMSPGDWMQIDEFKTKIIDMRQSCIEFISLKDAYRRICQDKVRYRKYAVLTFDDGYASLKEILPWLEEQQIPVTLFINSKYLDGKSYRTNPKERYLTKDELFALVSPLIEIGSHGWEHTNALEMNADEFKRSIEQNIELLHAHPNYIPFHAYTWGKHTKVTDAYLLSQGMIPLYMDGQKNYNDANIIHRELLQ